MLADEANTLVLFKFQYQIRKIICLYTFSTKPFRLSVAKKPVVLRRSEAMISCNLPCAAKMKTTDHGVTPRLFAQDRMQEL